jgi:hypothetical protein
MLEREQPRAFLRLMQEPMNLLTEFRYVDEFRLSACERRGRCLAFETLGRVANVRFPVGVGAIRLAVRSPDCRSSFRLPVGLPHPRRAEGAHGWRSCAPVPGFAAMTVKRPASEFVKANLENGVDRVYRGATSCIRRTTRVMTSS